MKLFSSVGDQLAYQDLLQLDGALFSLHASYGDAPIFNGKSAKSLMHKPESSTLPVSKSINDIVTEAPQSKGTMESVKRNDQVDLWKNYWLEYVNAFDKLVGLLPDSVTTVFVGRQAVELGMKFILFNATGQSPKTHDLGTLSKTMFSQLAITDDYMDKVDAFCKKYCESIEGDNAEYFRYPQYKQDRFFGGTSLSLTWLSYNLSLVLLKLIHYAGLEQEFTD